MLRAITQIVRVFVVPAETEQGQALCGYVDIADDTVATAEEELVVGRHIVAIMEQDRPSKPAPMKGR